MKRWLVAVIVTLAAACGSPSQSAAPVGEASAPPPEASAAATGAATQPPAAGTPEALAFTASLVGGGQIEGGDLAGGDVVLWFWAPW